MARRNIKGQAAVALAAIAAVTGLAVAQGVSVKDLNTGDASVRRSTLTSCTTVVWEDGSSTRLDAGEITPPCQRFVSWYVSSGLAARDHRTLLKAARDA